MYLIKAINIELPGITPMSRIEGSAFTQNNTVFVESYGLVKRDTWYHMAATYDGNTIKTYKNGALIAENTGISHCNQNASIPHNVLEY